MLRISDRHTRPLVAAGVVALATVMAPLASGADQPLLPGTTIPGAATPAPAPAPASASVTSGGQGDACAAGEGATVDPTGTALTDVVQSGSETCSPATSNGANSTSGSTGGTTGTSQDRSTASTAGASMIEATDATQLEITTARFTTTNVRSARKLGLLVTLRGQHNDPVRDGTVAINDLPTAKINCLCQRAAFTDDVGQAAFAIPVTASMLHKRLYLQITARTPTLTTRRLVSVRIP
ncbi:MAG TPA: hypothetical protein VKR23_13945 [Gaiellaceae bacterium]|nr:hypothetical protein [Gaiellaceae bacterium]